MNLKLMMTHFLIVHISCLSLGKSWNSILSIGILIVVIQGIETMAIKTIIVTTGRNEMVERILLRTTQETFLRKNEGLRGGRIMALKEEKIMALKEEKIMALKEGKIMALRGETVGLLIKEIIEYLIKGMMALLIGEIESLAIATLEIMAVGTCMTIAITIVETFASIITKNQSIVVIIDPTIVTIDSMTAPSADCTVFFNKHATLWDFVRVDSSKSNSTYTCKPGYPRSMSEKRSVAKVSKYSYSDPPSPSLSSYYHRSISHSILYPTFVCNSFNSDKVS